MWDELALAGGITTMLGLAGMLAHTVWFLYTQFGLLLTSFGVTVAGLIVMTLAGVKMNLPDTEVDA